MEYHVYPVPIPTQTLSVHQQLYVLEMDAHAVLETCECEPPLDLATARKRLQYTLYIHNEAHTMFEGTLTHKDSRFLVTFPYSGALPVCFVTYTLAVEADDEFQDVWKDHAFVEQPATSNVALAIARPELYGEGEEEDSGEEEEGEEDEDEDEGGEEGEEDEEGEGGEEDGEGEEEAEGEGEEAEGEGEEEADGEGEEAAEGEGEEEDEGEGEEEAEGKGEEEAEGEGEEAAEGEEEDETAAETDNATDDAATAAAPATDPPDHAPVPVASPVETAGALATTSVDGAFEAQVAQRAYPMDVGTPPAPAPRCHVTVTAEQVLRSAQGP